MLKRENRLSRELFSLTFKQGRRVNKRYINSVYMLNNDFKSVVVVGKKISKKAVQRNLLRRRVYALIKDLKQNSSKTGYFIFLIKPDVVKLTRKNFNEFIKADVKEILDFK